MTKEEKLTLAHNLLTAAEAEAKNSRLTETTWRNDAAYYQRMAELYKSHASAAENFVSTLVQITQEVEAGKL